MTGLFGPYPNSSGGSGVTGGSGSGGTPSPVPVPPLSSTPGVLKRTAGETIAGHRAVYVDVDNKLLLADLGADPDCWNSVCGITPDSYVIGNDAYARFMGEMSDPSFNFVGGPVYLGASGTLTQTIPTSGPILVLGHAIGPNTLRVQVQFLCNLA